MNLIICANLRDLRETLFIFPQISQIYADLSIISICLIIIYIYLTFLIYITEKQVNEKAIFLEFLNQDTVPFTDSNTFRALNFAFIWHSIYWGTITFAVLIWVFAILISPLFGRIGCGWICFMGTIQDFTTQHSVFHIKWQKPVLWTRILNIILFFTSAFIFFFIRLDSGKIAGIRFDPWFLNMDFNLHYKHVWIYDTLGAVLLGLFLERRWACRNLCFMGALCASGSSLSRLIPVVDTQKCNLCGKCETDCLVRIPIKDYVQNNNGLVTNSECLVCGRCIDSCKPKAMKIKFIWNRKKYVLTRGVVEKALVLT